MKLFGKMFGKKILTRKDGFFRDITKEKTGFMDMEKENKMGVKAVPYLVITMALPLMFSLLVQSLYNIVDGIFVSRISEKALTATSLAYPIQLLMVAVGVGSSVGVNAFLSREVGARNFKKASQIAATAMILSLIYSVILAVLGLFGADFFAGLFTKDAELADLCGTYLRICMVFCFGMQIQMMGQRFLQAVGDTVLSMICLVVGAVVNIILDPIMIFGLLGFPEMGITGAAAATVIGQWIGGITAIILNVWKNKEVRISFKNYTWDFGIIREIYKVGLPTIIMQAMGSLMVTSINLLLMPYSATAVAFFGIYYKLQNFLFMPMNGLGQAAIPIIGYNLGAKKKERINQVFATIIPAAAGVGAAATIIFLIFPKQLLLLFAASDSMIELGVPALRIICVTFIFSSVTTVLGYTATGLGNGVINMLGTALRQVILYVPFTWLFLKIGGISTGWYAIWISEIAAVIYSIYSVTKLYKKQISAAS